MGGIVQFIFALCILVAPAIAQAQTRFGGASAMGGIYGAGQTSGFPAVVITDTQCNPTTSSQTTLSVTLTPTGINRIAVALVSYEGGLTVNTGVTYGASAFTREGRNHTTGGTSASVFWSFVNPTAAATTVTATFSTGTRGSMCVYALANVSPIAPVTGYAWREEPVNTSNLITGTIPGAIALVSWASATATLTSTNATIDGQLSPTSGGQQSYAHLNSSGYGVTTTWVKNGVALWIPSGLSVNPAFSDGSCLGVPNCVAWFKADALSLSNNDPVATFPDSSGLGNDFIGSTHKPTFKTNILNGRPGILFDGVNTILNNRGFPVALASMIFIVARRTDAGSNYGSIFGQDGDILYTTTIDRFEFYQFGDHQIPINLNQTAHIFTAVNSDNDAGVMYLDNVYRANTSSIPFTGLIMGDDGAEPFSGYIFEVLVINSNNATDRSTVMSSLCAKYALC